MATGIAKQGNPLGVRELKCPECQGLEIRRKSTPLSFIFTLVLFLVLALLLYLDVGAELFHLRVFMSLAAIFSFGAVVAAGMSVLFRKNRCMECGHRWR